MLSVLATWKGRVDDFRRWWWPDSCNQCWSESLISLSMCTWASSEFVSILQVHPMSEEDNFVRVSKLRLDYLEGGKPTTSYVIHYQWENWPDRGVPPTRLTATVSEPPCLPCTHLLQLHMCWSHDKIWSICLEFALGGTWNNEAYTGPLLGRNRTNRNDCGNSVRAGKNAARCMSVHFALQSRSANFSILAKLHGYGRAYKGAANPATVLHPERIC